MDIHYVSIPEVDVHQATDLVLGQIEVTKMIYTLTTDRPAQFIYVGSLSECLEFLDSRGVEVDINNPPELPAQLAAIYHSTLN